MQAPAATIGSPALCRSSPTVEVSRLPLPGQFQGLVPGFLIDREVERQPLRCCEPGGPPVAPIGVGMGGKMETHLEDNTLIECHYSGLPHAIVQRMESLSF
jgi:hypothetical protein